MMPSLSWQPCPSCSLRVLVALSWLGQGAGAHCPWSFFLHDSTIGYFCRPEDKEFCVSTHCSKNTFGKWWQGHFNFQWHWVCELDAIYLQSSNEFVTSFLMKLQSSSFIELFRKPWSKHHWISLLRLKCSIALISSTHTGKWEGGLHVIFKRIHETSNQKQYLSLWFVLHSIKAMQYLQNALNNQISVVECPVSTFLLSFFKMCSLDYLKTDMMRFCSWGSYFSKV